VKIVIMKIIILIFLVFNLGLYQAQIKDSSEKLCQNNIVNGYCLTPNKLSNGLKTGLWSIYFDSNDMLTDEVSLAKSFLIVNYSQGVPDSICVMCSSKGKLMGINTYLQDTTWTENGVFLWYDTKGRLFCEEDYKNGSLDGDKDVYFASGNMKYTYEYKDDTIVSGADCTRKGEIYRTFSYKYVQDTIYYSVNIYYKPYSLISSERTCNGVKDGHNSYYYKNGNIRIDAYDVMGVRVKETYYDKKGNITKLVRCGSESEECLVTIYDKQGEIKKEYNAKFNGYGIIIYK
jgi:antitoxin component YwqK of YwqJK toxin-antitoxin module